jgi:hypothetical protein
MTSHSGWVRRRVAIGSASIALVTSGFVVMPAGSAHADAGSISITAECSPNGTPSGYVKITEDFTGLQTNAGYNVVATRGTGQDSETIADDSSYWYPEADGTRHTTVEASAYGPAPGIEVHAGDTFDWGLYKYYGQTTEPVSGTVTVGGPRCGPPDKASFAASPKTVRVSKSGTFVYTFGADANLHGKIVVTAATKALAHRKFVVPASGTEKTKLSLSNKARKHLKHVKYESATATVTLKNSAGSTSAHHKVVLKVPKH